MSQVLPASPAAAPAPALAPAVSRSWIEVLGWLTLAALLAVLVPLFLRMPVWVDVDFYDLCARALLRGQPLERDIVFLPPRGMPWALALVRSVLGWSSEAVRLADLAVISAIVWLLTRWVGPAGTSRAARVWAAVLLYGFYLTASDWLHCQPDVWMFLPALVALHLRRLQVEALAGQRLSARGAAMLAIAEGVCWAAGCLIKPFVAVPALATWLASLGLARRSGRGWGGWAVRDACCLLAGGLAVGLVWQGSMLASGSWSQYWQNIHDFRSYYAATLSWSHRCLVMFVVMWPWGALHLVALPVALGALIPALLPRWKTKGAAAPTAELSTALLAAFTLGWMFEAHFLQTQFDYQVAPVVLLEVTLVAAVLAVRGEARWAWPVLFLFVIGWVTGQPEKAAERLSLWRERLSLWSRCLSEGDSAALRTSLSLMPNREGPEAQKLDEVVAFLKANQVGEGELTCYSSMTVPLYLRMDLRPSTRYLIPDMFMLYYPERADQIRADLKASGQRYIVTDMRGAGLWLSQAEADAERPGQPLGLPPDFPPEKVDVYPYSEPVVFRAGRYYVHQPRK
jgi:hypothetical protein